MPTINRQKRIVILTNDIKTIWTYFKNAVQSEEIRNRLLSETEEDREGIIQRGVRAVEDLTHYALSGRQLTLHALTVEEIYYDFFELHARYTKDVIRALQSLLGISLEQQSHDPMDSPVVFAFELLNRLFLLAISDRSHTMAAGEQMMRWIRTFIQQLEGEESPLGQERTLENGYAREISRASLYLGGDYEEWVTYFERAVANAETITEDKRHLNRYAAYFNELNTHLHRQMAALLDRNLASEVLRAEPYISQAFERAESTYTEAFQELPFTEQRTLLQSITPHLYEELSEKLRPVLQPILQRKVLTTGGRLPERITQCVQQIQEQFLPDKQHLSPEVQNQFTSCFRRVVEQALTEEPESPHEADNTLMAFFHFHALKTLLLQPQKLHVLAMVQKWHPGLLPTLVTYYCHVHHVEQCLRFTQVMQSYYDLTGIMGVLSQIINTRRFMEIVLEIAGQTVSWLCDSRIPLERFGKISNTVLQSRNDLRTLGQDHAAITHNAIAFRHERRQKMFTVIAERCAAIFPDMLAMNQDYFCGELLNTAHLEDLVQYLSQNLRAAYLPRETISLSSLALTYHPVSSAMVQQPVNTPDAAAQEDERTEELPSMADDLPAIEDAQNTIEEEVKQPFPQTEIDHSLRSREEDDDTESRPVSVTPTNTSFHTAISRNSSFLDLDIYSDSGNPVESITQTFFGQRQTERWEFSYTTTQPYHANTSFHALGADRETIAAMLLEKREDQHVRQTIAPDISEALRHRRIPELANQAPWKEYLSMEQTAKNQRGTVRSRITDAFPDLPAHEALTDQERLIKLHDRYTENPHARILRHDLIKAKTELDDIRKQILDYCQQETIFCCYAEHYYQNLPLGIRTIEYYARVNRLNIQVWHMPNLQEQRLNMLEPNAHEGIIWRRFMHRHGEPQHFFVDKHQQYHLLHFVGTSNVALTEPRQTAPRILQQAHQSYPFNALPPLPHETIPISEEEKLKVFELGLQLLLYNPLGKPDAIFWAQNFGSAASLRELHQLDFSIRVLDLTKEALLVHYRALKQLIEKVLQDFEHTEVKGEEISFSRLSDKEKNVRAHREKKGWADNDRQHFQRCEQILSGVSYNFEQNSILSDCQNQLTSCFAKAKEEALANAEERLKEYPVFALLTVPQRKREWESYQKILSEYSDQAIVYYQKSLWPAQGNQDACRGLFSALYGHFYTLFSVCGTYHNILNETLYQKSITQAVHTFHQTNTCRRHQGMAQLLFDTPQTVQWPDPWKSYLRHAAAQTSEEKTVEYARQLAYLSFLSKSRYITKNEALQWENQLHYDYLTMDILEPIDNTFHYNSRTLASAYSAYLTDDASASWRDLFWGECWLLRRISHDAAGFAAQWKKMREHWKTCRLPLRPVHVFPELSEFPAAEDWLEYLQMSWLAWQLALQPDLLETNTPLSRKVITQWQQATDALLTIASNNAFIIRLSPRNSPQRWQKALAQAIKALPQFFTNKAFSPKQRAAHCWAALHGCYTFHPDQFSPGEDNKKRGEEENKTLDKITDETVTFWSQFVLRSANPLEAVQYKPLLIERFNDLATQPLFLMSDREGKTLLHHVMAIYPDWLDQHTNKKPENRPSCQENLLAWCFRADPFIEDNEGKRPDELIPESFLRDEANTALLTDLRNTMTQAVNEVQNGYSMTVTPTMTEYVHRVTSTVWEYLEENRRGQGNWLDWFRYTPRRLDEAFSYLEKMLLQGAVFHAQQFQADHVISRIQQEAKEARPWTFSGSQLHQSVSKVTSQEVVAHINQTRQEVAAAPWRPYAKFEKQMAQIQQTHAAEITALQEKAIEDKETADDQVNTANQEAEQANQKAAEERERADAAEKAEAKERERADAAKQEAEQANQKAAEERERADAAEKAEAKERERADAAEKAEAKERERADAAENKNAQLQTTIEELRNQVNNIQKQLDDVNPLLPTLLAVLPHLPALLPHLQALQPAQAEAKAAETQPSIETTETQATPDEPDASASASPNFFGHR